MRAPRAAAALYLALALHALLLLGLALRSPLPEGNGSGPGIGLAEPGAAARAEPPSDRAVVTAAVAAEPAPGPDPDTDAAAVSAPTAPPRTASTQARGGGERDVYLSRVRAHLTAYRRELPVGTGLGRAQVALRVAADGTVGELRLIESSGVAALDAEAVDLLRRASPLPRPPAEGGLHLVVPLSIGR